MTLEELRKKDEDEEQADTEEEDQDSDSESNDEESDSKKSFETTLLETMSTLTEHVKALSESHLDLEHYVQQRFKAMETPTDLPLKPATTDSEDIGADVKVPDEYQSNSEQASLDADGEGHSKDQAKLSMQEKAQKFNFGSTETPRPSAAIETVNKSASTDYSLILKEAREVGFDNLSTIGQRILKGAYYTPSEEERWF